MAVDVLRGYSHYLLLVAGEGGYTSYEHLSLYPLGVFHARCGVNVGSLRYRLQQAMLECLQSPVNEGHHPVVIVFWQPPWLRLFLRLPQCYWENASGELCSTCH